MEITNRRLLQFTGGFIVICGISSFIRVGIIASINSERLSNEISTIFVGVIFTFLGIFLLHRSRKIKEQKINLCWWRENPPQQLP